MSQNVPASFQVKFQNNVEMILQQKGNPIEAADAIQVQEETGAEKVKVKDIIGANKPRESEGRHGKTEWGNRTYGGIWIPKTNELYDADIVDNADELQTTISLAGTATMSSAATLNRARTRRFLEGFAGDQITGKQGTTTVPFPSARIIPAATGGPSGSQPLNTRKIRNAGIMLDEAFVDPMYKRFMVVTGQDRDALRDEVNATSEDYKKSFAARYDDVGNLTGMLGFHFIHIELDDPLLETIPDLYTDGSGDRLNPFWVKGGLIANYWQRLRSAVGQIPELRFSDGYFAGTTVSATRGQDGMFGMIANKKN